MATKVKTQYELKEIRLFRNNRGMVGFESTLYFEGKNVGSIEHDGNSMTYNVHCNGITDAKKRNLARKTLTNEFVDQLLEAKGF